MRVVLIAVLVTWWDNFSTNFVYLPLCCYYMRQRVFLLVKTVTNALCRFCGRTKALPYENNQIFTKSVGATIGRPRTQTSEMFLQLVGRGLAPAVYPIYENIQTFTKSTQNIRLA